MKKDQLNILWTNDNVITSKLMVLMYAKNAKIQGWFENVTVIIWGATAKLIAEDVEIQNEIKQCMDNGVVFSACLACADELGVTKQLENLDIDVKYWGSLLTQKIKNEYLITI